MKRITILLFMIISFSCSSKENTNNPIQKYNYKQTMKNIYYLNYDLKGDFEIIFNGISLTKNKKEGVIMNYEYLNPYIQKSGLQTITLILKPLDKTQKLTPETLSKISLEIYLSVEKPEPPTKKVQELKLPIYKENQDSILYTWTFDVDVPYEITTLNDAKNLSDEDPDKLLEEVLAEYKKVYKLINEGQINEYMNLYKSSREREMVSMYYNENKQKEYLNQIREYISDGKNHMKELKDYRLNISPNGKIVELEDNNGETILIADDGEDVSTYGLQLYRSSKTGKLEIY